MIPESAFEDTSHTPLLLLAYQQYLFAASNNSTSAKSNNYCLLFLRFYLQIFFERAFIYKLANLFLHTLTTITKISYMDKV